MIVVPSIWGESVSNLLPVNRHSSLQLGMTIETITDLATSEGGVPYSECLARLLIDDDVVLNGGKFIAQLETHGSIGLLDTAMVSLVLDALEQNVSLRLGCNISPYTLADQSAWESIVLKLAERPSAAMRLTLEITETAPLSSTTQAAHRLKQVQAYGCRIALDDFGSGFAIHSEVRNLAIDWDIIKIDRSFLSDLRKSPSGRDGLASMIRLARAIAPLVIVEGIETAAHLERARDSGASFGQGWLFDVTEPAQWSVLPAVVSHRFTDAMQQHTQLVPAACDHSALPSGTHFSKPPRAYSTQYPKRTFWQRLSSLTALTRKAIKPHEVN